MGVLPPGAMRAVAAVAAACGSGAVELTSRANLQLRGVTDLDGAARRLIDHGLALDDPRRDALRAVVASPLHGHDPTALVDLDDVLADVEQQLVGGVVGAVPPKFGVVLDDGGAWPLDGLDADLRLAALGRGSPSVVGDRAGRAGTPRARSTSPGAPRSLRPSCAPTTAAGWMRSSGRWVARGSRPRSARSTPAPTKAARTIAIRTEAVRITAAPSGADGHQQVRAT